MGRGVTHPGGGGRGLSAEERPLACGHLSAVSKGAGLPGRLSIGAQSQSLIIIQVDGIENVIDDETIVPTY